MGHADRHGSWTEGDAEHRQLCAELLGQVAAGGVLLVIPDTYWYQDSRWPVYPEHRIITANAFRTLGAPGLVDAYAGYSLTPPAP